MAITGNTRDEIRDAILTDWAARMAALGYDLDTSEGTGVYDEADTLAPDLLPIEGAAEDLGREVIPSTATTATLERQAGVIDLPRQEGTPWSGTATVTGTNGTYSTTNRTLVRSSRVYRVVTNPVTISGGTGTLQLVASEAGSDYAPPAGATFAWDSAPTGLAPTVTLATSDDTTGADEETDPSLAERVEGYLRCRPAGGNSQHLIKLAEEHDNVAVAYCYPCLLPNAAGGTAQYNDSNLDKPGCVVLIVAGPAQGQSGVNTRHIDAGGGDAVRALVHSYFKGSKDAHGNAIRGSRLYSAQLNPADFTVERPAFSGQFVDVTVTNSEDYPPPWTGSMTIDAGASTTTKLVVVGNQTALADGQPVAIQLATGATVRGRVQKRTLGAGVYNGGTNRTTWDVNPALGGSPQGSVDPAPDNWSALVLTQFNLFDALGPGDVPDAATVAAATSLTRRRRFPPESWQGKSSVSPASVIAALMTAVGAIDAFATTPGATVTPNAKTWLFLDLLRIRFP